MIDIVGDVIASLKDGYVIFCRYRNQYFFLNRNQIASDKVRSPKPNRIIFDARVLLE